MKFTIEYITNTGLKRDHNEDSILVGDLLISSQSMETSEHMHLDQSKLICVVADGMGGHAKGEVASKFVLEKIKSKKDDMFDVDSVKKVLWSISEEMAIYAEDNSQYLNMGTVLAGVLIIDEKMVIFSVGDCRVYENAFGYANQLSEDHSLVYSLYKSGEITYDQIQTHPKKNIVTSAFIGNKNQILKDIFIKEIDTNVAKNGLLLCSDGTWESLDIAEIESCFTTSTITESLKLKVLETEATDNFSVIYVKGSPNE